MKNRPISMKFTWYITTDTEPDYSHVTKNWNIYNSRWRRPPSWMSSKPDLNRLMSYGSFGHKKLYKKIYITHSPIVRFQRNFAPGSRTVCQQRPHDKTANFQHLRWRTAAILKIVKSKYLTENIVGFLQNLVYYSRYWTWWDSEKCYRSILDVIR